VDFSLPFTSTNLHKFIISFPDVLVRAKVQSSFAQASVSPLRPLEGHSSSILYNLLDERANVLCFSLFTRHSRFSDQLTGRSSGTHLTRFKPLFVCLHLPRLRPWRHDDPTHFLNHLPTHPDSSLGARQCLYPRISLIRGFQTTPTVYSYDMDRAREDEWPVQLPTLPYPPASASQQTDTSLLGRPKQQRPNTPAYPHPQSGNGNQLPPIRNLVPNLWEPGTSRSSQQISSNEISSDEGKNGSSVYRLHPIGPAWSGGSMNASDKPTPRPHPGMIHRENGSNGDDSPQANGSNKRPPSSPIERADHVRTASSNGINSDRGNIRDPQKPSQTQTGEKADDRPRSNSEATKPTSECPGSASQPSHQQELLRDPVGKLWSRVIHRYLTHLFALS